MSADRSKDKARKTRRRGIGIGLGATLVVIALLGLAVLIAAYLDFRRFTSAPLTPLAADTAIDVPMGATLPGVVRVLEQHGIHTGNPWYWRALARKLGVAGQLHAGEYALTPGMTPRDLLQRLAVGDVIQHRFTIVEGWTFRQLRLALENDAGLVHTLAGVDDGAIMRRLDAEQDQAEGWFLPETYAYIKGMSDLDLLRRARDAMRKLLDRMWPGRDAGLNLESAYQALVLASIVEKETGRADERPEIAGVFLRRLKLGMKLQTDPSVIYGLGDAYNGNLHRRDLDTDTPYNTYTRGGLPPTPIALPGKAALEATLHPAPGARLFFVARGDGTHEFSDTLDAHNRAVARYQLHRKP